MSPAAGGLSVGHGGGGQSLNKAFLKQHFKNKCFSSSLILSRTPFSSAHYTMGAEAACMLGLKLSFKGLAHFPRVGQW